MEFDYSKQYNKYTDASLLISNTSAERYTKLLRPYLPSDRKLKILEIGPGNGLAMKRLMQMGYNEILGIEVDHNLARQARDNGLHVEHISAEALNERLALLSNEFDLVFCMHVIEHVPKNQQIAFVRAVQKCLKSEGYFVCETPNALGPAANYYRYNDWTHDFIFTPISLRFLFENSGLDVLYAGAAPDGYIRRGGMLTSVVKHVLLQILRFISRSMYRLHYVAEIGISGMNLPLSQTVMAVGRKA